MKVKQIKMDATLGPKKMCYLPRAAFAAALATLGSTTEAKNATVDITGFPCWLNGTGWKAKAPKLAKDFSKLSHEIYITIHILLALFRILLGILCLLMHVNERKIRNFPCLGEITD